MSPFTPQLEALKGKTVRVVNAAFDDGTPHLAPAFGVQGVLEFTVRWTPNFWVVRGPGYGLSFCEEHIAKIDKGNIVLKP